MSGGLREAIATTEAIVQAIKREVKTESHKPTIVAGDFNKEPCTLQAVKELKNEESWVDVGEVAAWWGGVPKEPTCYSRKKAKPTRIDGMLVNPAAMVTTHDFEVAKHELVPTHCFLRLEVSKDTLKKERQYLRKVGSLKVLFKKKVKEVTEGMEPKEASEKRGKTIDELKQVMDRNFQRIRTKLEEAKRRSDTNKFWKEWSKAVEDAYITSLELESKDEETTIEGRGKVMISKRIPEAARKKEDLIRNESSREAGRALKQARRAEQILYRSEAMKDKDQATKETYIKLT